MLRKQLIIQIGLIRTKLQKIKSTLIWYRLAEEYNKFWIQNRNRTIVQEKTTLKLSK